MRELLAKLTFANKLHYRELIKSSWIKFIAGSLASLVVMAIIFTFPVKAVTVETTEPYYVTEISQEPYSTIEYYPSEQSIQKDRVIADGYYTVVPFGIIVPFQIDRPDARLMGSFENTIPGSFVIYNSANRIIWEKLGSRGVIDLALPPGEYRAKFQENIMWGEDLYIFLSIRWNEVQGLTTGKEITQYREVVRVVEKERKVLKEDRLSIWRLIFGKA
jgi:hypothetical protein